MTERESEREREREGERERERACARTLVFKVIYLNQKREYDF